MLVDWYNGIFEVTIPKVLQEYDNERFYWPTSPSTSANDPEKLNHGDVHFWRVWAMGTPLEEYKSYIGRFNSEYGMQSVPEYSSIIRFTAEKDRKVDSEVMNIHQRHINGWYLLPNYTTQYAGNTSDLERYSYFSQIMQSYGIQMAIESLRSAKPFCMGSLYWQLNDVWPVSSWATVDYYGMYKAAQYAIRNAYSTAYAFAQYKDDLKMLQIRVINDDIIPLSCQLKIEFYDFKGRELRKSVTQGLNVAAGYNIIALNLTDADLADFITDKAQTLIAVTINSTKHGTTQSLFYFNRPIDLKGTPPTLTVSWHNTTTVNISTTTLAKSVYLYDKTRKPLLLKTNYFDIRPNSFQVVTLPAEMDKDFLGVKEYFTERHASMMESREVYS
jgi:beta-mannosidase